MSGRRRARAHELLSVRTRTDILDRLRAAPEPLDAHAIAQATGLHVTTVRFHLTTLAEAGLVSAEPQRHRGRGRPRMVYSAVWAGDDAGGPYQELAELLAAHFDDTALRRAERAERAGHDWAARRLDGYTPPRAPAAPGRPSPAATVDVPQTRSAARPPGPATGPATTRPAEGGPPVLRSIEGYGPASGAVTGAAKGPLKSVPPAPERSRAPRAEPSRPGPSLVAVPPGGPGPGSGAPGDGPAEGRPGDRAPEPSEHVRTRGIDRAPGRGHDLEAPGRAPEGHRGASAEAVNAVVGLFTEMGFDPEPDGDDRILLHACPFRVTAQAHPEVVCAAHRGLLRATIARFDPDAPVPDLHAFARPDLCVATLSP